MEFRPKQRESGLRFGIVWSGIGSMMAVCGLAACSFIIPPDNQPARHNQLISDEKRRPAQNAVIPTSSRPTIQQQLLGARAPAPLAAPPVQQRAAASAAPQQSGNFVTRMPAQPQQRAAAAPKPQPGWFERNMPGTARFLGIGDAPNQQQVAARAARPAQPQPQQPPRQAAPVPFAAGQPETRQATLAPIPAGYAQPAPQPYQTANNQSYPLLQDTPPAPTNITGEAYKLERARQALEADERGANQQRDALQNEVDSSPSLLEEYGNPPVIPQQPRANDGAGRIPSFDETYGFAAPRVASPAPESLEPIILRPPASASSGGSAAKIVRVGQSASSSPRVASVSDNAYLPESRYATRRN